jgi:hypothetical protein
MKNYWFHRIAYLYLVIPFLIFCMGWLRLSVALPVTGLIIFVLWQFLHRDQPSEGKTPLRVIFYMAFLAGLWVFLSGVGGYSFQNWDHHWRNAVLHDLIAYDWPVMYSNPDKGPIKMLVYYVGYWLPAALAGKLLGWKFANFILFLWTWLGVFLVLFHLNIKLKASFLKTTLLFILFSGMDVLGTLLFASEYPTLWPPIQHLEIWSGSLQYSSFSTQLFWVFNQAVPAWLCCILILESNSSRAQQGMLFDQSQKVSLPPDQKVLIWSLCFFFAPLASIGLFPYLCIEWFKGRDFKLLFKNISLVPLLAGSLIVVISYLFFSSNSAAQERGFQSLAFINFLLFFLLEGGILWLLLAPFKWRDPYWIVTGLLLLVLPFIQIGSGRDFVMRASIAPLFYLMMMTGEVVFQNAGSRFYRMAFVVIFVLGALTPLYEINRSIYRTFEYYFILDESERAQPLLEPVTHLEQPGAPEREHPGSLTAEGIPTLKFMTDELSGNFIANVRQSLYYRFLSSR